MGRRMSIQIHFLDLHLDNIKEITEVYLKKQGEIFYWDLLYVECRYHGLYNKIKMEDNIWCLIRESNLRYKRKYRKTFHL